MEHNLDKIAEGNMEWNKLLSIFYQEFEPKVEVAFKNMEKKAPEETGELCPNCGSPLVIKQSKYGKFTACSNYPTCKYIKSNKEEKEVKEIISCPKCDGKIINQFDHFCGKKGLDIKGLSKATLEKLIDWGWIETYEDLYKLKEHRTEWVGKPGFGAKSVDNILSAIEESKTSKLESFISAIGIPLIGNTVSKELVKHVNSYEMFRDMINNKEDFTKFDNIAEEKAKNILNFDYADADAVYKYMNIAAPALKSAESESPQPLKDFNILKKLDISIERRNKYLQEKINRTLHHRRYMTNSINNSIN